MHSKSFLSFGTLVIGSMTLLAGCAGGSAWTTTPGSGSSSGAAGSTAAGAVEVTLDPSTTHAISPYVYGVNSGVAIPGASTGATIDRAGGNRWTAYNWQTNASNAGSDYLYESDDYLSGSSTPAEAVRAFIASDQAKGMASIVTFQMQGLVAGDESGPVGTANPPDMTRFKTVVFRKSSVSSTPFTVKPPTAGAAVFMDEFIWALDQKFRGQGIFTSSPSTKPVFAELDNEPELWNTTHLEVQGRNPVTSDAYIAKTISLATALKTQFPGVVVFGPVHYGFQGIYSWQGELAATPSGSDWFPDKYLPAIQAASATFGRPLVDVYDFHWYSEATDGHGNRVTNLNDTSLTDAQVQAIAQSPRSLWDSSYTENSWITRSLGQPIDILGRLQSRIAAENPGMKLAITEYHNGGAQHIAGTLAQADNLGIFGEQQVFAANYWPLNSSEPYILAGFRAYRNFDGSNSNFGDTSVKATSSDVASVAAHASTDSARPGRIVIVAINRSAAAQATTFTGQAFAGTAHLYRMTASSAKWQWTIAPVAAGTLAASGSTLTVTLPALSVTTIDVY
ncbi:MAG TPA: glycoside hydrolase family 44 protein [Burkholderiaceae bacterium]|nr:glycoside hydrolase family 44 protein [Burkholderiaceae bacterium]